MSHIEAKDIWASFRQKLLSDTLAVDDIVEEAQAFLHSFLSGEASRRRRDKFLQAEAVYVDGEQRKSVILRCDDDDYRFDFVPQSEKWKLSIIECITLPVDDIADFPYHAFRSLTEKRRGLRRSIAFREWYPSSADCRSISVLSRHCHGSVLVQGRACVSMRGCLFTRTLSHS